ncbi:ATP-binding protein [Microbacterium sp. STN6]|uniref:ATP-binding protein n=1 Tax=Microbacterium sp. STN6 TaxID=2995588 RepID=UPI0022608E6C|nr:ATP-binding protein [Microbacterium sp. STN6]MCX7522175.1 ATP-binding protein [Microbacterium sp. STN6]
MSSDPEAFVRDAVQRVLSGVRDRAAARCAGAAPVQASVRPVVVLIDGPSGAGKSTLATALAAAWPASADSARPAGTAAPASPTVVRLDDIYPGWDGLEQASDHIEAELLRPFRDGGVPRWRRHDWVADAPAEWHGVARAHPLIVEGCGALTRGTAPLADLRVWVTADDAVRKRRALARDNGGFDAHWEGWQRQFERFLARERPLELADFVIDAG